MNKDDIDELFASELEGVRAPVSEADWKAFQAQATKGGFWTSKWFLSLVTILIVSGSVAAFIISAPSAKGRYQKRTEHSSFLEEDEILIEPRQTGMPSNGGEVSNSSSKIAESVNQSNQVATLSEDHIVNTPVQENLNPNIKSSTSDQEFTGFENKSFEGAAAKYVSNQEKNLPGIKPLNQTSALTFGLNNRGASVALEENAMAGLKSDQPNQLSREQSLVNPSKITESASTGESQSEFSTRLEYLESLLPSFDSSLPLFNSERKEISQRKDKMLQWFLFVRPSIDRVWGGSFSAGIGGIYDVNKWRFSAAAGYFRSGKLNWNQERREVYFGFNRYESVEKLTTKRIEFIQVPLDIYYRIGGNYSIFAGGDAMIKLSAQQTFKNSNDFIDEGFIYSTTAPNVLVNVRSGVSLDISEMMSLDLGVVWSPFTWESIDNTPLGAFAQLKYTFE
ncbi:MAG: hypothetical protein MK086_09235 [Flavobacteriales bacterium]|nr:hypothetical protein [Flavobacteriales bacterium]